MDYLSNGKKNGTISAFHTVISIFFTREDSQLLHKASEIYVNGTFCPVAGVKRMFPQRYIFSICKELSNKSIIALSCAFVNTSYLINYKAFKNIKTIVTNYLAYDGPSSVLSPSTFLIDFEKVATNAIPAVFPLSTFTNCFFHCLRSWTKKLCGLGFKPKIERNEAFDPMFLEFWNFLSGIPIQTYIFPDSVKSHT